MTLWTIQVLNGISFAMLLFLLAAGLSVIFGLMNVVNLAHGSYYLLGAYVALEVQARTGDFLLAILGAALAVGILGMLMERLVLHRFQGQHLAQVLLTFGFLLMLADISLWKWGGFPQTISKPGWFEASLPVGGFMFPTYRLLIIGAGSVVALFLWWLQERTGAGATVRAAVDDQEMAHAIGINVPLVMTLVFGLGAALAALAGVMGGPFVGAFPGLDIEVLLLALVVVIIGGLGSLKGVFIAALAVGLLDTFGKALFPELSLFTIFAPMAIILAVRPTGLFGRA